MYFLSFHVCACLSLKILYARHVYFHGADTSFRQTLNTHTHGPRTYTHAVLVYDGDVLPLTKVSRNEMGAYLCIATNGVPPSVSKRIILDVECKYEAEGRWKERQTIYTNTHTHRDTLWGSTLYGAAARCNTRLHLTSTTTRTGRQCGGGEGQTGGS